MRRLTFMLVLVIGLAIGPGTALADPPPTTDQPGSCQAAGSQVSVALDRFGTTSISASRLADRLQVVVNRLETACEQADTAVNDSGDRYAAVRASIRRTLDLLRDLNIRI